MTKLEQAENRRTRVRQKLLEHVAGALIMQPTTFASGGDADDVFGDDKIVGMARQVNPLSGEDTPPRSPIKSTSPQRLADPVKVFTGSPEPMSRRDVESIRIYADSDVYALLADVEEEINRMGQLESASSYDEQKQKSEFQSVQERDVSNAVTAGITLNAVAYSGTV